MRKSNRVYYFGIVVVVVSMIGLSRYRNAELFIIPFAVGFAMILSEYIK